MENEEEAKVIEEIKLPVKPRKKRDGLVFNIGEGGGLLRPEQLVEVLAVVLQNARIGFVQVDNTDASWEEITEAWPKIAEIAKDRKEWLRESDVCLAVANEWYKTEHDEVREKGKKVKAVYLDDLEDVVKDVLEWQKRKAIDKAEKEIIKKGKRKEVKEGKKKLLKAHNAGEDTEKMAKEYIDFLYSDSQWQRDKRAREAEKKEK